MPTPRFSLVYARDVLDHLAAIERKHHAAIRRAIETKLSHEPMTESRNRKPLSRPSVLEEAWELRCGPGNRFRVFYRADEETRQVRILAIGEKQGSRLTVGSRRFQL
jgi:mRNA-degrading endonuclease RelE of RelBE toxin-antitoxin system